MFAKRLRELRTSQGLTQEQLAKLLNISKSSISMYENGHREPDSELLIKLANYYSVTTDYILGRVDDPMAKYISLDDLDSADCTSDDTIFYETSAKIRVNEDMKEILRDYCEKNGIEYSFEDTSSIDKMFLYSSTHVDELKHSIMEMLEKLDDIDKAEIRGEMRQMLKADKYNKAEPKNA